MKLLLDENLPRRLKWDLQEFEVFTVRDLGWNGVKNGELLKLMLANEFKVLVTFDKNLEYQQNFDAFPISVLVLTALSNQYKDLRPLIPAIKNHLTQPEIGATVIG